MLNSKANHIISLENGCFYLIGSMLTPSLVSKCVFGTLLLSNSLQAPIPKQNILNWKPSDFKHTTKRGKWPHQAAHLHFFLHITWDTWRKSLFCFYWIHYLQTTLFWCILNFQLYVQANWQRESVLGKLVHKLSQGQLSRK
jgi:hypothetical protein